MRHLANPWRCGSLALRINHVPSTLAAVRVQLTPSSNDSNRHKGNTKIYAGVVYYLSRRYPTDNLIAKADEGIRNFKRDSFSQKLWYLTVWCRYIYNKQALRRLFVEGVDHSIHSTMCHQWVDNRETLLEDLAHQAQSVLNLKHRHQKRWEGRPTHRSRMTLHQ